MNKALAFAGILIAALAASNCTAKADRRIQLRYMAWGNVEQLALEQELVDRFNRRNPDLNVRLFKVPQSAYGNKSIVMFASRTSPDVVRVDHFNFPQLAERNYFRDLSEFTETDPEFDAKEFFPLAMQENYSNGKLLALNVLFGGGVMIYNKTLLKKAGLPDPFELWKRGEWTTDRTLEYAIKLTKFDANGRPSQFGVGFPNMPFYVGIMYGYGANLLSEDLSRSAMDTPEATEAMQWVADLRWKHRVCPSPSQGANAAFGFETGRLAMEFNYIGVTSRYREKIKDFEWDICPMPDGPKGKSLFVKGNQLVMYRETKHPAAAWRLLKFIVSEEAERFLYIEQRRQSPTRIKLAQSSDFLQPKAPPFNMPSVTASVELGKVLPIGPRWPEVITVVGSEFDSLFAGRERDAKVVLKRAHIAVNKLLSEDPGL